MYDMFAILDGCRGSYAWKKGERWGIFEPSQTHLMAFTQRLKPNDWENHKGLHAVVESDYDVVFAPLDHNDVYVKANGFEGSTCDAFIYSADRRVCVFVELKNRVNPNKDLEAISIACIDKNAKSQISDTDKDEWLPKATVQLRTTIERFSKSNPKEYAMISAVHDAYVANRKLEYNMEFMAEGLKELFKKQTGFNLRVNNFVQIQRLPPPIKLRFLDGKLINEMTT